MDDKLCNLKMDRRMFSFLFNFHSKDKPGAFICQVFKDSQSRFSSEGWRLSP